MKAEVELAAEDDVAPPLDRLQADVREALSLLESVESAVFAVVPVLLIDDDERLGELTARGLRRLGYAADWRSAPRPLRPREVVVLDLGATGALAPEVREQLRAARPIVITGGADAASRARAEMLDASAYLLKPVDLEQLAAAISARAAEDGSAGL